MRPDCDLNFDFGSNCTTCRFRSLALSHSKEKERENIKQTYPPPPALLLSSSLSRRIRVSVFELSSQSLVRCDFDRLMSHPKRHTSTSTSSGAFSTMKKPKSQPLPFSLEKNGLHHLSAAADDDSDLMLVDADLKTQSSITQTDGSSIGVVGCSGNPIGVAANLSRKKATPPQPAKKLVIKLTKGALFLSIHLLKSFFLFCLLELLGTVGLDNLRLEWKNCV